MLPLTPLLLTYNEAPNLPRTLEKLRWANQILVIDSFSTDDTLKIIARFPQAKVIQRKFDSFAGQCNFGLQNIATPWVLSLDADYLLPESFIKEIESCLSTNGIDGYSARFDYCVFGKPLRSTLYPPRTVLYRKDKATYHDEGHGHRVQVTGPVRMLSAHILHDDRKPLERWFAEQIRYSAKEAKHLVETALAELNRADRIRRKIILAPALIFFYTLIGKGLILDGWPGWFYVFQRTLAELLLSLRLIEQKLRIGN